MRKQKKQRTGVRLFPALAAVSILLLVGGYMGFSKAVTAVQGSENDDMQAMMQSMSGMMGDMKEMYEECEKMHEGMHKDGGMMGSSNGAMSQEEHESHHQQ